MFLSYLQNENKQSFLKLCVYAALSNGVFAKEEKEMISTYCREMNIPENVPDASEPIESLLEEISKSANEAEKNIIVLEILGLLKSDGVYDEKEKVYMEKLVQGIGVKEGILSKINSLLDIYEVVCKELYSTITE